MYVFSSALTPSSARAALAGPRDRLGHPDTAYHKSASHSLKHGLADALKYILEWAAVVCTAIPHLSVQFVLSLDHFLVPSVLPRRDRFDQFNTALS